METFLAVLLATLVTIPILAWFIVYQIGIKISRKKKKSFHLATDVTTAFLIASVQTLLFVIWGKSFFSYILIFIILITILISFVYWKKDQDFQILKVLKTTWRFNFLVFFSGYIILFIYGLIDRVITQV